MPIRCIPGVAAILALFIAAATPPAAADPASHDAMHNAARNYHTHTAGIFVGGASDDLGKREGFALGLEYEYRFDRRWGIGFMLEHTYGEMDTWVYVMPIAYHVGRWKLYAAPGVEDGHHGSENMVRVGFEYGIHLDKWEISPQFDIDFVERERDVFVVGLTFARGFDF